MLIECPSGLSFHARKWKIGDRRNLHDNKIIKQGLLLRKMLEAVDQGVEDPGPYELEAGKKVQWIKIALSDIISALIDIRISTKPELDYNDVCEQCGAKMPLSINLTELNRVPMSSDGIEHLSTGNPLETMFPTEEGEVQAKVRALVGSDAPKIAKYYKQDPSTVAEVQAVLHLVEIQNGSAEPLKGINAIWEFYKNQDWDFQNALGDFTTKVFGGVETQVETECQRCSAEQNSVVPFTADFFYPPRSNTTSSMAIF
jgi:hypothetical protein